ncbi:MAG TPA: folylpolyglutamate synthase/dihydrofolate synthase family protein [Gallionella sp.]|nr:folylpolyglutamate synthase/dihydrofolate synthase family protein [Gallionella sp.]
MPDTLAGWLAYLDTLHPKNIALGLERVAQVKQRMNLLPGFPVIVVGGTNGKGSVCALLESMLHASGYRVGCYTSPHLLRYNERVRIATMPLGDAELCASFERVEAARSGISARAVEETSRGGKREHATQQIDRAADYSPVSLTYFEFGTLAAMQCFIEHKVDVAILEVGLGGRLDAVNAFDNDCAVVASVDIDHTEYLGETREQIAFEKAGIFRGGKVAICADADLPQAVADHARAIGAELWRIGHEFGYAVHQGQWDYRSVAGSRNALPYPALRGSYQLDNASAALAALDALKYRLPVNMEAVRRGLVEVRLAGRFQFVPGKPQMILDVAHNPHAARSLAQNLGGLPPCPHTWSVFSMLKDKDIAGVVSALDPHIDTWLVAGLTTPRGATAEELERVLVQCRVRGEIRVRRSISDALSYACNAAGENDRIIAFGSFYTVAEAMSAKGMSVIR